MKTQDKALALLPNGFADLLPPDAEQEAKAKSILMKTFGGFGYARVKPPFVEFEDSLFAPGPGASLVDETFRLMDPVSHKMMGVRSDITVQIARIAASRLAEEPRPLRLTYANDVLRTRASQQRTERQFCQVGCEIIGNPDTEVDIESCVVALQGLKALGINNITIDLSYPPLVQEILNASKVPAEEKAAVWGKLARRERGAIENKTLNALIDAAGPAEDALKKLKSLKLGEGIKKLEAVYKGVSRALDDLGLDDIKITIDPVESRETDYHCGIAFTLFSKDARGELGRGGRYTVAFGESINPESATGFTLYMDTVRRAMPAPEDKEIVFVPSAESWDVIKGLQNEGHIVLRGSGDNKPPAGCTHVYKDGKVKAL